MKTKQKWSTQEHDQLARLVEIGIAQFGSTQAIKWPDLAEALGTGRSARQCRERWENFRPDARRGNWTIEEEDALAERHAEVGPTWNRFIETVERSSDAIKNHFNSLLRTTRLDSRAETLLTWYVALIRAGCPQDKQIHYARELRQARDALNPALPRPLLTAVVRAHLEARGDYNPPARPLDFSPDPLFPPRNGTHSRHQAAGSSGLQVPVPPVGEDASPSLQVTLPQAPEVTLPAGPAPQTNQPDQIADLPLNHQGPNTTLAPVVTLPEAPVTLPGAPAVTLPGAAAQPPLKRARSDSPHASDHSQCSPIHRADQEPQAKRGLASAGAMHAGGTHEGGALGTGQKDLDRARASHESGATRVEPLTTTSATTPTPAPSQTPLLPPYTLPFPFPMLAPNAGAPAFLGMPGQVHPGILPGLHMGGAMQTGMPALPNAPAAQDRQANKQVTVVQPKDGGVGAGAVGEQQDAPAQGGPIGLRLIPWLHMEQAGQTTAGAAAAPADAATDAQQPATAPPPALAGGVAGAMMAVPPPGAAGPAITYQLMPMLAGTVPPGVPIVPSTSQGAQSTQPQQPLSDTVVPGPSQGSHPEQTGASAGVAAGVASTNQGAQPAPAMQGGVGGASKCSSTQNALIVCQCGIAAMRNVSMLPDTVNLVYYTCGKSGTDPTRCRFVHWAGKDEPESAPFPPASVVTALPMWPVPAPEQSTPQTGSLPVPPPVFEPNTFTLPALPTMPGAQAVQYVSMQGPPTQATPPQQGSTPQQTSSTRKAPTQQPAASQTQPLPVWEVPPPMPTLPGMAPWGVAPAATMPMQQMMASAPMQPVAPMPMQPMPMQPMPMQQIVTYQAAPSGSPMGQGAPMYQYVAMPVPALGAQYGAGMQGMQPLPMQGMRPMPVMHAWPGPMPGQ